MKKIILFLFLFFIYASSAFAFRCDEALARGEYVLGDNVNLTLDYPDHPAGEDFCYYPDWNYVSRYGSTYSNGKAYRQRFPILEICSEGYVSNGSACVLPIPTCSDDEYLDSNNTCQPKIILDISSDMCSGSYSDLLHGYHGILSYNSSAGICSLREIQNYHCSDYSKSVIKNIFQCDRDLNYFSFSCSENNDTSLNLDTSCTPKNGKPIKSPCSDFFNTMKQSCIDSNKTISGECKDNGLIITKNTLECVIKKPECDSKWGEIYNASTNQCDCADGYYKDRYGNCSYDFFGKADENLTDEQKVQKKQQEISNNQAKNTDKKQKDLNKSLAGTNNKLGSLGDGLAGVRSDLNTTNNLLNDIKDKLGGDDSNFSFGDYVDPNTKAEKDITDALQSVSDTFDGIASDFTSLSAKVENGFNISPSRVGTAPVFETTVFGNHVLRLSLCDSFSRFYAVFFYMFVITFTFFSVRIFIFSFMLRG